MWIAETAQAWNRRVVAPARPIRADRFLTVLQGAVALYGGVRAAARLLGISPSTVSRLNRSEPADPKTAKVIGPLLGVCPCCQQDWPND